MTISAYLPKGPSTWLSLSRLKKQKKKKKSSGFIHLVNHMESPSTFQLIVYIAPRWGRGVVG